MKQISINISVLLKEKLTYTDQEPVPASTEANGSKSLPNTTESELMNF